MLAVNRERLPVERITVCLDVMKEDGTAGDVTLVQFGDKVLAESGDSVQKKSGGGSSKRSCSLARQLP